MLIVSVWGGGTFTNPYHELQLALFILLAKSEIKN
jgi:hypothetical protein